MPERVEEAPEYSCLQGADWTFRDAFTQGETHGIHPYPAKFIPQIPRALIAALHRADDTAVLDPFCGSGTTLVEAVRSGIEAVGVDLHPLACLISKVKVTPLTCSLTRAAEGATERGTVPPAWAKRIPAIDHWFSTDVQYELGSLAGAIADEPDADVRDALRVALSSIVVRMSRQESDTRYAAIDNDVKAGDVSKAFLQAARKIEAALAATWNEKDALPRVSVINKDILAVSPRDIPCRVSLVVSSPPYPNAYEYWLYHKYRMYWLQMDPLAVREKEIGARPHYFKRTPQTPADFERQIRTVFHLLRSVVIGGGHACFQVGSSLIHGQLINNGDIFRRAAVSNGFAVATVLTREIPKKRKSFNLSHARINAEEILVFRREYE